MAVLIASFLFVLDLGSIGLVDETPPLFAASARQMAESGDWLIPHVNGLDRYDKPPLVYWLMAMLYALPGHSNWDPLGSWAAALPSALASSGLLILISLVMAWWERRLSGPSQRLWLLAPLTWGVSPLVVVWSRIGVSDSLLTALLSGALLLSWLRMVSSRCPWWLSWALLGLAVLTKGPVAWALFALTWAAFAIWHRGLPWRRLELLRGVLLSAAIALPWYAAAALREGSPFLQSFFGYHNLQRFTEVVNHHRSPWWFYGAILLLASLPWSGALLIALVRQLQQPRRSSHPTQPESLLAFCSCWLLAVLLLFSVSATKLPSYWLPATPAAAILVATLARQNDRLSRLALRLGIMTSLGIAVLMAFSFSIVQRVNDPELILLPSVIQDRHFVPIAASVLVAGVLIALFQFRRSSASALLAVQGSWFVLFLLVYLPLLRLGDALRSKPLREIAADVIRLQPSRQPIVMAEVIKPSLHFYTRAPVAYEGTSGQALVDLHDRLRRDPRVLVPAGQSHMLLVGPLTLPDRRHWAPLLSQRLAKHGRYGLWWLDLQALARRAESLQGRQGLAPTWQRPQPERF